MRGHAGRAELGALIILTAPKLSSATEFRPTSPADETAVAAFLAEAFKDDPAHPAHDPAQFRWKYWQPRAEGPATRSFVLVRDGQILAHAGVVPGRCIWRGGGLDTLHLIEWAARPGAIGAGGALLKQIGRTTEALLAIGGNPRTLAMLPALGFRSCGEATPFIRSLRPLRMAAGAPRHWRTALRVARGVWWKLGTSDRVDPRWQARRVMPDDFPDMPLPQPAAGAATMARSPAHLRELMACPATPMQLYRLDAAGRAGRGYFLLAFAPGQARLVDCWVDSDAPADWRALVQHAVRAARSDPAAAELVALSSDPLLRAALGDSGFHARTPQPIQLLAKPDPGFAQLRVQMLDNDAAWLHAG